MDADEHFASLQFGAWRILILQHLGAAEPMLPYLNRERGLEGRGPTRPPQSLFRISDRRSHPASRGSL